ncbi:hypothetical protein ABT297_20870 [Dactylosporangium sp. NPDC000555]|uniref:hypothetical protein n=1 Tax=Dactylosporangium sp. NPDC000555 TaxID=3154260 RepID=UPI003327089B
MSPADRDGRFRPANIAALREAGIGSLTLDAALGDPRDRLGRGIGRAVRSTLSEYPHRRVPSNLGAPQATVPRLRAEVGEIEHAVCGPVHSPQQDAVLLAAGRAALGEASTTRHDRTVTPERNA